MSSIALNIMVGADPEVFIRHRATKQLVSAHNLLPGTKTNPHPVSMGAIQVDGVAGEFNINPAVSASDFYSNCQAVLMQMQDRIGIEFETSLQPVAIFPRDTWATIPEDSKVLGCTPDYNAWTGQMNPRPSPPDKYPTMRTAAGHVHASWGIDADPECPSHQADCCLVGRQLDYYLGMVSLMWDSDNQRREVYGKAGAIRFKPYGVEYRTMSNAWLRTEECTKYVFTATVKAIRDIIIDGYQEEDALGGLAQFCINNSIKWWTPEGVQDIKDAGFWPKSGDWFEDNELFRSFFSCKQMKTPEFTKKLVSPSTMKKLHQLRAN